MCMGCMASADFVVTGGLLGAASLRVGARQLLPRTPRWARKVSDGEARELVASLAPQPTSETPLADGSPSRMTVDAVR